MFRALLVLCSLTLLTFTTIACESDDDPVSAQTVDTSSGTEDAQSVLGLEDIEEKDPCEGIQSQPSAQTEPYHDECEGIEECTQMEPKTEGSCFCAICGKKTGQAKCLQVQCPQG